MSAINLREYTTPTLKGALASLRAMGMDRDKQNQLLAELKRRKSQPKPKP